MRLPEKNFPKKLPKSETSQKRFPASLFPPETSKIVFQEKIFQHETDNSTPHRYDAQGGSHEAAEAEAVLKLLPYMPDVGADV